MTLNINNNKIEENKSKGGVKGHINDWHARHPVISCIICLFVLGSLVSLTGCKDKSDAADSSNANSAAANNSNANHAHFNIDSESGSASCSIHAYNYSDSNRQTFSLLYTKLPDMSDGGTILLLSGSMMQTSAPSLTPVRLQIKFDDGISDSYDSQVITSGILGFDRSAMSALILKMENKKTMTITVPSGQNLKFNITDYPYCLKNLNSVIQMREKP